MSPYWDSISECCMFLHSLHPAPPSCRTLGLSHHRKCLSWRAVDGPTLISVFVKTRWNGMGARMSNELWRGEGIKESRSRDGQEQKSKGQERGESAESGWGVDWAWEEKEVSFYQFASIAHHQWTQTVVKSHLPCEPHNFLDGTLVAKSKNETSFQSPKHPRITQDNGAGPGPTTWGSLGASWLPPTLCSS